MDKTMTLPQINKCVGNIRAMLEKHADNFPSDAVQAVLGDPDFAAEQFKIFRERVESRSGIIVRDFVADLSLVGMVAIDATGRRKFVDDCVVMAMPRAVVPGGKICFFGSGSKATTSFDEVEAGYSKRGLVAVDPHTLTAFNAANPGFADTYPNSTLWRNADDYPCSMSFGSGSMGLRGSGGRYVKVGMRNDNSYWTSGNWFAGVSKSMSVDR